MQLSRNARNVFLSIAISAAIVPNGNAFTISKSKSSSSADLMLPLHAGRKQQVTPEFSSWRRNSPLYMKPSADDKTNSALLKRQRNSDLYAVSVDTDSSSSSGERSSSSSSSVGSSSSIIPDPSILEGFWLPVLSAAALITGNTVGASMLVLPDLAAGPGMGVMSAMLFGSYIFNLISGLAIAQVAIQQHESSGSEVPSSFKEFAEANLPSTANIVSGISIFINALILAFDTTKAGQVIGTSLIPDLDVHCAIYIWAAGFASVVATQSLPNLSRMASILVMGLFASFAGLLLPGIATLTMTAMDDPMSVIAATAHPAANVDIMESVLHAAPVVLTTLVYQNVVPSVTRILDYDRTKTMTAIALGSFIPLLMFLAWCTVVLGGGTASGVSGSLMTIFSLVTVAGSSLGALISLSEEFQIILPTFPLVDGKAATEEEQMQDNNNSNEKQEKFSLSSVALPTIVALLTAQFFESDIKDALKIAGSFGSPLLYGLIPVAMAWAQQQQVTTSNTKPTTPLVPGGMMGLGALGLGAVSLMGSEAIENLNTMML